MLVYINIVTDKQASRRFLFVYCCGWDDGIQMGGI